MPAQTVVTQRGDRLVELTKRVYQIRDPDRALTVALVVSTFSPKNRAAIQNRIGVPLEAGLEIEFPEFADIQASMKAHDARKKAVQDRIANVPKASMAPVQAPRAVTIINQAPLGERTLYKDILRALGGNAATLSNDLRPLAIEDIDPKRTQSPAVAKVLGFGQRVALDAARPTLAEIFAQNEKAFVQTFEIVLRQANGRAFLPNVDTRPTLQAFQAGFFMGLRERLVKEAKEEVDRRNALLQKAIDRVEPATFAQSAILGADGMATLKAGGPIPAAPLPGILSLLLKQYGIIGSAMEKKVVLPPPPAMTPYLSFLDVLHTSSGDGALVDRILQLANRVSDSHRQAMTSALALTSALEIDTALGPNQALAAVLPVLLKQLRDQRTRATAEEQQHLVADERHLLSGRNFVSFRKDVAQQLDKRITMAAALDAKQRMSVLLALLIQDGHRLPAMRKEDVDTATDRLIAALS